MKNIISDYKKIHILWVFFFLAETPHENKSRRYAYTPNSIETGAPVRALEHRTDRQTSFQNIFPTSFLKTDIHVN